MFNGRFYFLISYYSILELQQKASEVTFTELIDLVLELKDSSLVIASMIAMHILEKKLK